MAESLFSYDNLESIENATNKSLLERETINESKVLGSDLDCFELIEYQKDASGFIYDPNRYRYDTRQTEKKGICLHYTVSGNGIDNFRYMVGGKYSENINGTWVYYELPVYDNMDPNSPKQKNCVPYLIDRSGRIYQYYHPDYWAFNSGLGYAVRQDKVIGIELVNVGYLMDGDDRNILYWQTDKGRPLKEYCRKSQTEAYWDLSVTPNYGNTQFRGHRYYATFTEAQYTSLRKLLFILCSYYKIPYKFIDPQHRFKHYTEPGFPYPDLTNLATEFNGIFSHVNTADVGKWDIGPAFEWEQIEGNQICYPFEDGQKKSMSIPSVQWYANTEASKQGGYFPIGTNRSFHSGVHLFSNKQKQEVKAMAPGQVVAFRFLTKEDYNASLADITKDLHLRHAKPTSFVLLRHECILKDENTSRSFYSLYMDLEIPTENDMKAISWLNKIKRYALGSEISLDYSKVGETKSFETVQQEYKDHHIHPTKNFKDLDFTKMSNVQVSKDGKHQPEQVITISDPAIYVEAGEIIGYTQPEGNERNYVHWEVFSDKEETLKKIIELSNIKGLKYKDMTTESEDGIYDDDELKKLFNLKDMESFQLHLQSEGKSIKEIIADHYYKDEKYSITMHLKLPQGLKFKSGTTVIFEAFAGGNKLKCTDSPTGKIAITLPGPEGGNSPELSIDYLSKNNYTITLPKIVDKIQIITPQGVDVLFNAGKRSELLKDQVMREVLFRNAIVNSKSPWTSAYWESTVEKLKTLGGANKNFEYNKEKLMPYIILEQETEFPLYDSIFKSGSILDPEKKFAFINPVTFGWLILSPEADMVLYKKPVITPKENKLARYCFIRKTNPGTSEKNSEGIEIIKMGEEVKFLAIAEEERMGLPNPSIIEFPGQSIEIMLSDNGLCIKELNTQYWGTFKINGTKAIENQLASFEIEKPKLGNTELKEGFNGINGSVKVSYEKNLPKETYLIMKFQYTIEGRTGFGTKETDYGLVILPEKNEKDSILTGTFNLQNIFNIIDPLKDKEQLKMSYKIVLYNCLKEVIYDAIDTDEIKTEDLKAGKYVINLGKINNAEYVESTSGYQQFNLTAVAPAFGEPLGLISRKGTDDTFRIGNGLQFLSDIDISKFDKIKDHYRAETINIISPEETVTILQSQTEIVDLLLDKEKRQIMCLISPLEDYFAGSKELFIAFKNNKGINHVYETKAKIINPIKETKAEYISAPERKNDVIRCSVTFDENIFPSAWIKNCRVVLEWYYNTNPTAKPEPDKIWIKEIENKAISNNELKLDIPFTEIRGNSFTMKLYTRGSKVSVIGKGSRVTVSGIPEEVKNIFNSLKCIVTGDSSAAVNARKESKQNGAEIYKTPKGEDVTIENGTNVFVLFDENGKYIMKKDDSSGSTFCKVEAQINNAKQACWIFNSRIEGF